MVGIFLSHMRHPKKDASFGGGMSWSVWYSSNDSVSKCDNLNMLIFLSAKSSLIKKINFIRLYFRA